MIATLRSPDPLPGDPLGQQLCSIFGRYLWCAIEAAMPEDANIKPEWTTITGYPLRPRVLWNLWRDAKTLVGVRFTHETSYALIDIDAGSQHCNPEAIANIRAALETIGITRTLLLRSSWSGGLHLYIPFPEPVNTFNLAVALKECLKVQGFAVEAGQLEIFPNVKRWGNPAAQDFSEYNGHRLPLQPASGSCLLDDDFNPLGDSLERFFWLWDGAAAHQDLDSLNQAMVVGRNNHRKRPRRRVQVAQSWRDDLEIEISEGWTGHGQTNSILKAIACYGVVFERLQGEALETYILRIATTRPGYETYCRHQADIQRRVTAWAKAAESYYWPLGSDPKRQGEIHAEAPVQFNQQLSEAAQERIRATVQQLEKLGQLPEMITARAKAIASQGRIALRTLYKNLALWHPHHQEPIAQMEIPEPERDSAISEEPCSDPPDPPESRYSQKFPTSLEFMKGGSAPQGDGGSALSSFTSNRGVRGDEACFPQPPTPAELDFVADITAGCRRQVQRLGWDVAELQQFVAEHFKGKPRSQLDNNELILLLYYLQSLEEVNPEGRDG